VAAAGSTLLLPQQQVIHRVATATATALHAAAKKKVPTSKAKGFGKVPEQQSPQQQQQQPSQSAAVSKQQQQQQPSVTAAVEPTTTRTRQFLQSIDNNNNSNSDESVTDPEERAKQLLRDTYGMKTLQEQQLDAAQLARSKEEQKKWAELKRKAELNQDLDLFSMLPAPVLVGIDRVLKAGVVLSSVAFVMAGLLITVEAWSKTASQPLPVSLDTFITATVEPNFTPGLLVLLTFSVSLGIFSALQLGSQGATYKEDE
jgi:hypothetical protein